MGFSDKADLDDGSMWPTVYAITKLGINEEAKIISLVKKHITLSSFEYAGMPYHVLGIKVGAVEVIISCILSPILRSVSFIFAKAAATAFSPFYIFVFFNF